MILRRYLKSAPAALAVGVILLGCGSETRKPGELCEDDDECPPGLECLTEVCGSVSVISHCSVECVTVNDCEGFSEPSCVTVSGLTRSCVENGKNPCEP
jgi:hypothetical protein